MSKNSRVMRNDLLQSIKLFIISNNLFSEFISLFINSEEHLITLKLVLLDVMSKFRSDLSQPGQG